MLEINISNVEELVFYDKPLQRQLPEFDYLFSQWRSAQLMKLKSLKKQSLYDLLNLIEERHVQILENYFKDKVAIAKFDTCIVQNVDTTCSDVESILCEYQNYKNFSTFRRGEQVYISFWR